MAATDLFNLLAEWLDTCKDAVAAAPGGEIAYRFVAPGPPPLDCAPQLTVYAGGPQEADTLPLVPPLTTGQRDRVQGSVDLVNLTCVVVRCAPTLTEEGEFPSIASQENAARETDGDVWSIWNMTRSRHRAGTLFASASNRRELFLDPAFPIVPSGGYAGWQIPIRVQLGGYEST